MYSFKLGSAELDSRSGSLYITPIAWVNECIAQKSNQKNEFMHKLNPKWKRCVFLCFQNYLGTYEMGRFLYQISGHAAGYSKILPAEGDGFPPGQLMLITDTDTWVRGWIWICWTFWLMVVSCG
jgi:hypothetical protein